MLHAQGQQTCGDLSQRQNLRVADETQVAEGMVAPIDAPSRCGEIETDLTEDSTCADVGTAAVEAAVAVGTRVDETGEAKATVHMVICKDDGNLGATVVRTKTDEHGVELVLRFVRTCGNQDRWRTQHCGDCSTGAIPTRQNNEFGTVERRGSPRDWRSGTSEWDGSGSASRFLS